MAATALTESEYEPDQAEAYDRARTGAAASPPKVVMQVTWSLVAGGSEMYALTVASNLDADRFTSVLCAVDQGGALEPEIKRLAIPYFIMNRKPGIELRLAWRLYRLFRKWRVDVIHTHHFNQLFYSVLGAKLAGARIIHTEHSVECFKRKRLRVALRLLSLFCDRIVVIGEEGARALSEEVGIPARKIEIIRAGIDASTFQESRREARQALGLKETDRVAAIVARLFPEKNHKLLLNAFADVARKVEGARLLIVGEGVERDTISEEIARLGLGECVEMLGVRRDVARLLAASDVFVLSSDREGLPIAVLEAMAAGRPVVATAVGDLPLVVRDRITGRLVPPRDAARLADALVETLGDQQAAARMGEQARRVADEGYTLRAMIDRFETIYGE